jgi:hypothetical protein
MIHCVWYPSGGFGHYINAVLSLYGNNFVRPKNAVIFGKTGDLHQLDLSLPKYFHDQHYPPITTNNDQNYCVLIDNGINNESTIFKKIFLESKTIKICYTNRSWPIVAHTMIVKAMQTDLNSELSLEHGWSQSEPWAIREKYFLYLRDHALRYQWQPDPTCYNLLLESLLDYHSLQSFINSTGIVCENFKTLHNSMLDHNQSYFYGISVADKIIHAIETDQHISTEHITNLWDQAVVNYFIQLQYGVEVPANDWANWFQSTKQIKDLL